MSKKKKERSAQERIRRLVFPSDESVHPWLPILMQAYCIVDRGVAKAVHEEKKRGGSLACAKGCSACCSTHKDIPLYPLELEGIIWYTTEKMPPPLRDALKQRLHEFRRTDPCPFLVEGICSIHKVRPMACRQFNVFGRPCDTGEDPYFTRRHDVMAPVKRHVDQAFFLMLPLHGIENEAERRRMIESGAVHRMVRELHRCNWHELAERMEQKDRA